MHERSDVRRFFESVSGTYGGGVHRYSARRRGEAIAGHACGDILEVGCGSGAITAHLIPRGTVIAGDIASGMVRATRKAHAVAGVAFDGRAFPFKRGSIDCVVSSETLYYLDDPSEFIREAHRVLRPGGTLAVTCIHAFWQRFDRVRIRLRRLGLRLGPIATVYRKGVTVGRLKLLLSRTGFSILQVSPTVLLPWEFADAANRFLEKSPLAQAALFWILVSQKPKVSS